MNISIITICYNNLEELKKTMYSVDQQIFLPCEHFIVDGSTNSMINNYLSQIQLPFYREWKTESDKGIADAMNKGIRESKGNIILILNAGDELYDESVLKKINTTFEKNSNIQWLHGKYMIQRSGHWIIIGKPFDKKKLYRGMRSVCHQTMYVRKELYDKYGLYDENERIAMDYDFVCRICKEKNFFLSIPLAKFAPQGISTIKYIESLKSGKRIYTKYFGFSIKLLLWQIRLKILYYLLQTKFGKTLFKLKKKMKLENI